MATYVDNIVSTDSGTTTSTGTLYTCPASKIADCTLVVPAVSAGVLIITAGGAEIYNTNADTADREDAQTTKQFTLMAGETIAVSSNSGSDTVYFSAKEYSAP